MSKRKANLKDALRAFLRAELDSPSESERVKKTLSRLGAQEEMICENSADTETLWNFFREYRGRETLFDGLDLRLLEWYWIELALEDLQSKTFTCINHFETNYGTRRPTVIASAWNASQQPNRVLEKITEGDILEPPILIGDPALQRLVILEGHNRLISYLRDPAPVQFPIDAIVGTSSHVSQWCQW